MASRCVGKKRLMHAWCEKQRLDRCVATNFRSWEKAAIWSLGVCVCEHSDGIAALMCVWENSDWIAALMRAWEHSDWIAALMCVCGNTAILNYVSAFLLRVWVFSILHTTPYRRLLPRFAFLSLDTHCIRWWNYLSHTAFSAQFNKRGHGST